MLLNFSSSAYGYQSPYHQTSRPFRKILEIPFASIMLANILITNRLSRFLDTQKWHKRPHISCLESLPVELLQSIAGYLSLSAAASFALSSKYIWYVVGSQYWHQLRSQPFEYKIFLGLLEKTMTGHWLCYECLTFHPKPKLDSSSRYYFSWPACKCDQSLPQ